MIIPATLDAHCRGLPALIALWNSRKQNFLMFNSKTWITVVFLHKALKWLTFFCRNINHVAMDFIKTSKMEMSQIYVTISGQLVQFLSFCWYFLLQSLQQDLQKYTKGKLFGWTQVSKRLVFTQSRGQVKLTCNYWNFPAVHFLWKNSLEMIVC